MMAAFKALERPGEGVALLKHYLENYASIDLLNIVYQATLEHEGMEVANQTGARGIAPPPHLARLRKIAGSLTVRSAGGKAPGRADFSRT